MQLFDLPEMPEQENDERPALSAQERVMAILLDPKIGELLDRDPRLGEAVALTALDAARVGTPEYTGRTHFWADEFHNVLWMATRETRKRIHDAFIEAGLALDGVSGDHLAIIKRLTANSYSSILY